MRKWIVLTVAVSAVLVTTGCGYHEGIREPDRQSYIWFTGETKGAVAIIDDNESFKVDQAYNEDTQTGEKEPRQGRTIYQVKPGKHEIVVKKDGVVVVHRVLMIGAGATKEVRVP
jgi:hypothetical protein